MNPIFQVVIIAYLFLLIPFLTGVLEAGIFRKEKKCASEIFANGYLIMLAIFYVFAEVFVQTKQPLSVLAKVWLAVTGVIFVLAGVFGRKVIKTLLTEFVEFWKGTGGAEKNSADRCVRGKYFMLAVLIVSVIVSIGFTKPDASDATVEIVRISVETDSMYLYDAYSGYQTGYIDAEGMSSPIEMLYAVGTVLSGMDGGRFVYYLLPICLLLLFFSAMWRVGSTLFEKEEQRVWFELITILLYWMTTYAGGRSIVMGVFLNCWNGLTLLSCILLPLAFSFCLSWMKRAEAGLKIMPAKLEKLLFAVVLVLAGQLAYSKGGFYIGLMLFLCIAVILVKGGYAHGITSGRFKKCI